MNTEKLYKKVGRRYIEVSIPEKFDMDDGVWLIQKMPSGKSFMSLMWLVGDLKRPADITTHAAMQSIQHDISRYIMNLTDKDSNEYQDAKNTVGSWLNDFSYSGVSASDLALLILRRISTHLEEGEMLHWDMLQYKFREDVGLEKLESMDAIKALYAFTEWLKENDVKFRQGKNIG
jgi:uncharacterized protein YjbK